MSSAPDMTMEEIEKLILEEPSQADQIAAIKGHKELLKGTNEQIEAHCGALKERLGELRQLEAVLFSLKVLAKEARDGLGQQLAARDVLLAQRGSASAVPCSTGHEMVETSKPVNVCNKVEHLRKDCAQREATRAEDKPTEPANPQREPKIFTASLSKWRCGVTKVDGLHEDLVGAQTTAQVQLLGMTRTALLDIGSQVSIIPLQIVVDALQNGYNLNADVEVIDLDRSKAVYDASGNPMSFKEVSEKSKKKAPAVVCVPRPRVAQTQRKRVIKKEPVGRSRIAKESTRLQLSKVDGDEVDYVNTAMGDVGAEFTSYFSALERRLQAMVRCYYSEVLETSTHSHPANCREIELRCRQTSLTERQVVDCLGKVRQKIGDVLKVGKFEAASTAEQSRKSSAKTGRVPPKLVCDAGSGTSAARDYVCQAASMRSKTRNPLLQADMPPQKHNWTGRVVCDECHNMVMVRQRRRYMDRLSHATTQHSSDSHTPFGELAVFFGSSCSTGDTTSSEVFVLLTTITKQVLPITRLVESTAVQAVTVMYGER
ncbi:unnamed protein product [Heligmosomoides polygyrus]|uniref:Reverse transcriptase domain-containing protein n=1 Tax=Heligmosomoides polygyrus TaxID=6339 RepID=A0A3P8EK07_HELPZ|nr:unnamed protein product [Heligmosomoides polygyrus]